MNIYAKKAVIYVRVSTEDQASNGISIDNQKCKCVHYCKLNDIKLLEIIDDAGKSGKDLNRGGIQKILKLSQNSQIDAVIVYKLDRLSRNTRDMLDLIKMLKYNNVELHSLNEKLDTSTPQGQFFLTMISALSQLERDLIAERTRDALRYKKDNGYVLGKPPFGLIIKEGKYEIEFNEYTIVKKIKELYQNTSSYTKVAKILSKAAIPSKTGKSWTPTTIRNVVLYDYEKLIGTIR